MDAARPVTEEPGATTAALPILTSTADADAMTVAHRGPTDRMMGVDTMAWRARIRGGGDRKRGDEAEGEDEGTHKLSPAW